MCLRNRWLATTVLAAVINFSTLPAQAEVYRWVDAEGRVHFGDSAPKGQKAETLEMPEADKPASPTGDAFSDEVMRQRQDKLSRVLEEERLEKERAQADVKQKAAEKEAYCERFKNRMERLEASSQVYSENKDGSIRYWKDKDADRYKADQRKRFKQECGTSE
ncbi:MAG TPA: DUF4124 domain-containing protein [Dongiaceae bacterium]|nr:DUF4124 domain-containing protein [Dongiaceae bacterium]